MDVAMKGAKGSNIPADISVLFLNCFNGRATNTPLQSGNEWTL